MWKCARLSAPADTLLGAGGKRDGAALSVVVAVLTTRAGRLALADVLRHARERRQRRNEAAGA
jgi:hypothetical protein